MKKPLMAQHIEIWVDLHSGKQEGGKRLHIDCCVDEQQIFLLTGLCLTDSKKSSL
jgi:hypothetical protein